MDRSKIEHGVRLILEGVGEDLTRPGLVDTPKRVAAMYEELFCGLGVDLRATVVPMSHDRHQEMVLIKDIDFFSVCEHHLVPFSGKAHVAYIPSENGHITGLSGLARLVRLAAARPQLQERITSEVADSLQEALQALGTFVLIEAEHLCISMRGVRIAGAATVTSAVRGVFRTNAATRAEVLALIAPR